MRCALVPNQAARDARRVAPRAVVQLMQLRPLRALARFAVFGDVGSTERKQAYLESPRR
jgi:hypothetical protein